MTGCSTVTEVFLNQIGESKRKRNHWSRGVASPTRRTAKGRKGLVTEILWIFGTSSWACLCSIYPQVPKSHKAFDKQIGENLDYIITAKFCRVVYASKKTCLLENRWCLAQMLTYELPIAQPQHCAGTSSQGRCNWAAIHMYCPGLFWSQGWFCLKLWKSAILPVWHTGNPLPVNHSVIGRVLPICFVVFYSSESSVESKGRLTI